MSQSLLSNKKIILGVTGSIALYKACEWVRNFQKNGADLQVIMTTSAQEFVSPLSFAALSGNKVFLDMFDPEEAESIPHIQLGQTCDLMLIAPATAQTIARLAHGLADDLLSTVVLAATCPVLICPAMNSKMYLNPATQANLQKLRNYGYTIIEPDSGEMACGDTGPGRLPEWEPVYENVLSALLPQDYADQQIVVTAGPTQEPLDPVRFLSNRSSGKMGYAIAKAARRRGAKVTLISGPSSLPSPAGITVKKVKTAQEMYDETFLHYEQASIIIKAAAVSDYRPEECQAEKIKKGADKEEISLVANQDILKALGAHKASKSPHQPLLIGFAAESSRHFEEGQRKLQEKNLDMIVINDIKGKKTGFESDTNKVTLLDSNGAKEELPLLSKDETAMRILDKILSLKQTVG